jgi:hypothetical protein
MTGIITPAVRLHHSRYGTQKISIRILLYSVYKTTVQHELKTHFK